jgi:hypothetical protein
MKILNSIKFKRQADVAVVVAEEDQEEEVIYSN